MNLELLFWAAKHGGNPAWYGMALSHALRSARDHVRGDGSTAHVVDYAARSGKLRRKRTRQGYARDSTWSRGQAWAVYGFTMAYRETGDRRLLAAARRAADWYFGHLPADLVPTGTSTRPASWTPPATRRRPRSRPPGCSSSPSSTRTSRTGRATTPPRRRPSPRCLQIATWRMPRAHARRGRRDRNGRPGSASGLRAALDWARAPVAQWTERLPSKQRVAGSNPAGGTRRSRLASAGRAPPRGASPRRRGQPKALHWTPRGERSSVGRAPGCGPGGRRFESGRSPSEGPGNPGFSAVRGPTGAEPWYQ